jgi:predicted DNA-binding protein with PD1-like motif
VIGGLEKDGCRMAVKDEAEALRLALISGCVSTQEVKEWVVAQIGTMSAPESTFVDLVASTDRPAEIVTLLGRIGGDPESHAVALALGRRVLAAVARHPMRAESIAAQIEQIVRAGEWPEGTRIDIDWITDGFALARQGIWAYDQAVSNFQIALTEIGGD